MWENIVQPDRPQMTVWRMPIACWIPKVTNMDSEYVIFFCFSTATMVARTRLNVTIYFEGAWFESWPDHRLSSLRCWCFHEYLFKIPGWYHHYIMTVSLAFTFHWPFKSCPNIRRYNAVQKGCREKNPTKVHFQKPSVPPMFQKCNSDILPF